MTRSKQEESIQLSVKLGSKKGMGMSRNGQDFKALIDTPPPARYEYKSAGMDQARSCPAGC